MAHQSQVFSSLLPWRPPLLWPHAATLRILSTNARQDGVVTKTILTILTVLALIAGALALAFQGAQVTAAISLLWSRHPGSRRRKLAEALTLVDPGDSMAHIERRVGQPARGGLFLTATAPTHGSFIRLETATTNWSPGPR
jgi:hypothetical protein